MPCLAAIQLRIYGLILYVEQLYFGVQGYLEGAVFVQGNLELQIK